MDTFWNRGRSTRRKEIREQKEINDRLIKDEITRDIRTLFGKEDYYKPKRVNNFYNNNYIEYKRNDDGNRNLSLDEHLNKIKPYLRGIKTDLQNCDTWKIQLTIAINFVSSKNAEKERLMHSKSNNIKFTSCNDANKVVDEHFHSFRLRYEGNLESSMEESECIFDSVVQQMLYY